MMKRMRKRARYGLEGGYGPMYVRASYEPGESGGRENQSEGQTYTKVRPVSVVRKPYRLSKLLSSTVNHTEQCMGVQTSLGTWQAKHPVSEFGPLGGGFVSIGKNLTNATWNTLPMHVYDLNHFIGNVQDNKTNWPTNNVPNVCADTNARAWYWSTNNNFNALIGTHTSNAATTAQGDQTTVGSDLRWYVNEPKTNTQIDYNSTKVFRKSIAVDFMVYGMRKMVAEYDIRIIKILDPRMCPDWNSEIQDNEDLNQRRQNWQNLIRAYTINPMLKGIEPGPKPSKPWFVTVAKKKIRVGEQTSDVDRIPSVKGRLYVGLNEVNNMAWSLKDFAVEAGRNAYDFVPNVEDSGADGNMSMEYKPYWTSRYYLVIRALAPVDMGTYTVDTSVGLDNVGTLLENDQFCPLGYGAGPSTPVFNSLDYCPTYDIAIRTHYLTVNANS